MQEVEVKILNVEKSLIQSHLTRLGAEHMGKWDLESIFLRSCIGSVCRIRREGNKTVLNTKIQSTFQEGIKTSQEYEIFLDGQFYETVEWFEKMGFRKLRALKKKRTTYIYKHILFSLDENFIIPDSLEIEAENMDLVQYGSHLLGFVPEDFCHLSENALYASYNEERGILFQYSDTEISGKDLIIERLLLENKKDTQYHALALGDLGEIFTLLLSLNIQNQSIREVLVEYMGFSNKNMEYLYAGFSRVYPRYLSGEIHINDFLNQWNRTTLDLYFEGIPLNS